MADIKKIFKDEIIGDPKDELVYNNKVEGVFGEMASITPIELHVKQDYNQPYNHNERYNRATGTYLLDGLIYSATARAYITNTINYDNMLDFSFETPIENVNIGIKFYYEKITLMFGAETLDEKIATLTALWRYIDNLYDDDKVVENQLDFDYGYDLAFLGLKGITVETIQHDIFPSDVKIDNFSIRFKIGFVANQAGLIDINFKEDFREHVTSPNRLDDNSTLNLYQPRKIEIIINGDTFSTITQTYQIGKQKNAMQLKQNPLVTTKSYIVDEQGRQTPLYQWRANKIIEEWNRGKQIVTLTKVINKVDMLLKVGDKVYVLNKRGIDFKNGDEQKYSFYKNKNGFAKLFNVTKTEFVYDGSYKQILELQED